MVVKIRPYRCGEFIDECYVITHTGVRYFVLNDSPVYGVTVRDKEGRIYTICREDIAYIEEAFAKI